MTHQSIGGKADGLLKLQAAGFLVPRFFILSTDKNRKDLFLNIEEKIPGARYFAVRSSAFGEDSSEKSFAGNFYSGTGISKTSLTAESEKVWASMAGFEGSIIIQEFVAGHKSGVVFSEASKSRIIINANFGLCETVVHGKACDEYIAIDGSVFKEDIAKIKEATYFKKGKRVKRKIKNKSVLAPHEIRQLFKVATAVEKIMGCPQDIEWCFRDRNLFLLQSRPITRAVIENRTAVYFDSANIAESYSGIVLPLTYSFASFVYKNVYSKLLVASGVKIQEIKRHAELFENMLGFFYGRMYYNMNNWYRMMAFLPGYERNKKNLEAMITSNVKEEIEKDIRPTRWLRLKYPFLLIAKIGRFSSRISRYEAGVLKKLRGIQKVDIKSLDYTHCKKLYLDLQEALLEDCYLPVENDFLVMTCLGILQREYPPAVLQDHLRFKSVSTDQITALKSIANHIKDIDILWKYLQQFDFFGFSETLLRYPKLRQEILDYFSVYGGRFANELKLESEDIEENFERFSEVIQLYAGSEVTRSNLVEKPVLEGIFLKRFIMTFILCKFRKYAARREKLRLLRSNIFGVVRKIFKQMGDILAQSGQLCDACDIFYLRLDEVLNIDHVGLTFQGAILQRKKEYVSYEKMNPPNHFSIFPEEFPPSCESEISNTKKLVGRPSAPGKIIGKVKIFKSFSMPGSVNFDIVVARHTDPGWVPLLGLVKGLIIEEGGILSHASIVARELGIPTVIGVKNATSVLQDYQTVELDGRTGIVTILEEARK